MIQQYQAKRFTGTTAERKQVLANVAHLLNKLRTVADEAGQPITGQDEDTFWKFISTLPAEVQSSVIN